MHTNIKKRFTLVLILIFTLSGLTNPIGVSARTGTAVYKYNNPYMGETTLRMTYTYSYRSTYTSPVSISAEGDGHYCINTFDAAVFTQDHTPTIGWGYAVYYCPADQETYFVYITIEGYMRGTYIVHLVNAYGFTLDYICWYCA